MKIQVVVLVAALALLASGYGQAQDSQVYCGRRLAQTLAWLCQTDYLVKRSGYNSVRFGYEPEYGWPWLAAARAHGMRGAGGAGGARAKRQVVSECCEKPCTVDELLTYCN